MARGRPAGRGRQAQPEFHSQMVLFKWALANFGVDSLKQFSDRFQITPETADGIDPRTGLHRFYEAIANALPTVTTGNVIPVSRLEEYERNILSHTERINKSRVQHGERTISWKYHQYLALLFTEVYLDQYFDDPAALRDELNACIAEHNQTLFAGSPDDVAEFDDLGDAREQLSRLAFWCATGSGKTLLMHVNILQFRHYHKQAYESRRWPKLDQIILVTPNEGLSQQHTTELECSGFEVIRVDEQGAAGLFAAHAHRAIKILDIHKFRDEQGQKTVATEAFEGCNLVLVDEGHRGAGRGDEGAWMKRRDELSQSGFCIEYSATFKEAVKGDDTMSRRYARSILFDYAYRSFYRDGYGKDFSILNLEDDDKQKRYLTTALLLFYQQIKVWKDGGNAMMPFLIEKPLWVFVGHTVTGGVKSRDDRESVSDVVEVLLFLKQFLADPSESVSLIESILSEGFTDQSQRNLIANRLPHLDTSGDKAALAPQLHSEILSEIFHAPGGGTLAVQLLKNADGELALKVGAGEPFGVVNVGDPGAVAQACEDNGVTRLEDDESRESLFQGIGRDDSPINLLVGSRKFTEGWNSWRVSSIGLMRMGRNEGTQIVQLFGRGVRLKGYQMSLRRSSVLSRKPATPPNLRQVETLQVFGVKASYMRTFQDWIYSEVPEAQDRQIWELPAIKTLPDKRLKTLRLKEDIDGVRVERGQAFRKLGPLVRLRPPHPTAPEDAWLREHPTRLNWLPRVFGLVGENREVSGVIGTATEAPEQHFSSTHVMLMDIDALLFGLEEVKASSGLDRLHADRDVIRELLLRHDWYMLLATADDMRLDRYENRAQWQRMAQQLLNGYADRFYRFMRSRWEAPYLEVAEVDEDDPSIISGYSIESTNEVQTQADIQQISQFVTELQNAIQANAIAAWSTFGGAWRTVPFAGHLYQPLLYVGKGTYIRISPISLNKGEAQFVTDLAAWCGRHSDVEVYLLRNMAVTGLGFFQAANFYPDFLLWVVDDQRQKLVFVDPKGLHHHNPGDPKIQFATRDIPRLQQIVDACTTDLELSAYIISNTPFSRLGWSKTDGSVYTQQEIEALGVLFQQDDPSGYISALMGGLGVASTV